MNENQMAQWISKIWAPHTNSMEGPKLLLIDVFAVHLTSQICALLGDIDTKVEFISPGFTSKLQVKDVGIDKPFKDQVQQAVETFLSQNDVNAKPSRQVISHWIGNSWEPINAWQHVGFFGGVAPHPNLKEEEMNKSHDPLALMIPHISANKDDKECDADASFEF